MIHSFQDVLSVPYPGAQFFPGGYIKVLKHIHIEFTHYKNHCRILMIKGIYNRDCLFLNIFLPFRLSNFWQRFQLLLLLWYHLHIIPWRSGFMAEALDFYHRGKYSLYRS